MDVEFATGANGSGIECSDRLLRALDDPQRRAALGILAGAEDAVPEARLAERVAAVDGADDERVRQLLHHQHLPILAAADLVDRTPEGVSLPATLREDLTAVLDRVDGVPTGTWATLTALLSDPVRWAVAAELEREGTGGTVHVDGLAATLADRADLHRTTEDVAAELHHLHLPRLAETGLLSYHAEAGLVEYRGHGALAEDRVSGALAAVTDFERALSERV
jgi:hypothetical protein